MLTSRFFLIFSTCVIGPFYYCLTCRWGRLPIRLGTDHLFFFFFFFLGEEEVEYLYLPCFGKYLDGGTSMIPLYIILPGYKSSSAFFVSSVRLDENSANRNSSYGLHSFTAAPPPASFPSSCCCRLLPPALTSPSFVHN